MQTQVTNNYSNGAAFGNDYVHDTWGVGKLDSTFGASIANEVRYQIGRDFEFESGPPPNAYEANTLFKTTTGNSTYPSWTNYTNPFGIPTYVALTNAFNFGEPYYDTRIAYPNELRNQIADTVTWSHGKHTIKFGGDFSHVSDQVLDIYQQNGQFGFSSVSNYLDDLYAPAACSGHPCTTHYSSFAQGFGPLGFTFTTNDIAMFAQDDWKVMPRLTFSFGMRWELQTLPAPIFPNPAVPGTTTYPDAHKDFGPRVGFAWDVFGNGKTAVRGGFGIFYGRIINGTIFGLLTQSGIRRPAGLAKLRSRCRRRTLFPGGRHLLVPTSGAAKPLRPVLEPELQESASGRSRLFHRAEHQLEHRFLGQAIYGRVPVISCLSLPMTTCSSSISATATDCSAGIKTITYFVGKGGPVGSPTFSTTLFNQSAERQFQSDDRCFRRQFQLQCPGWPPSTTGLAIPFNSTPTTRGRTRWTTTPAPTPQ